MRKLKRSSMATLSALHPPHCTLNRREPNLPNGQGQVWQRGTSAQSMQQWSPLVSSRNVLTEHRCKPLIDFVCYGAKVGQCQHLGVAIEGLSGVGGLHPVHIEANATQPVLFQGL
jgi:hypothetical protein